MFAGIFARIHFLLLLAAYWYYTSAITRQAAWS